MIRSREPTSRTFIRRTAGLRLATITEIVQELLREKLLVEIGESRSGQGRRPIMLRLNPASRQGIAYFSSIFKHWREVPVKRIQEERVSLPVFLEEDIRAKILCEQRYGAGRDAKKLMYVDIGIGCGLAHQAELYRGATESAGELGHMRVTDNGPICQCGSPGCLEAVASLPALAQLAANAIRSGTLASESPTP